MSAGFDGHFDGFDGGGRPRPQFDGFDGGARDDLVLTDLTEGGGATFFAAARRDLRGPRVAPRVAAAYRVQRLHDQHRALISQHNFLSPFMTSEIY